MSIDQRTETAERFAAALVAEYRFAKTRVWAKGEQVRVYVSDPRDKGHVAILADGTIEDHTRGLSAVVLSARRAIGAAKTIAGTNVVVE